MNQRRLRCDSEGKERGKTGHFCQHFVSAIGNLKMSPSGFTWEDASEGVLSPPRAEVLLTRPVQNTGHPDEQICDHVAPVYFV
jgi:hypothetical protein